MDERFSFEKVTGAIGCLCLLKQSSVHRPVIFEYRTGHNQAKGVSPSQLSERTQQVCRRKINTQRRREEFVGQATRKMTNRRPKPKVKGQRPGKKSKVPAATKKGSNKEEHDNDVSSSDEGLPVASKQKLLQAKDSDDQECSSESGSDSESESSSENELAKSNIKSKKKSDNSSSDDDNHDGSSSDDDNDDDEAEKGPRFTDENAKWLKPKAKGSKQQLLSSDDDNDDNAEEEGNENDSDSDDDNANNDDDDEDDEEDLLEIEKEAKLVDEEMEAEREEADEELRRTVRENTAIYHLPTQVELERDVDRVVPPSEIRSHIDSILEVLAEFKSRREAGRSRKEYIHQLGSFISELYGYLPELVEYFLTMFGPAETLEFVDLSDKPRPLVIRTNTLKARRKDLAAALMKRGVTLDPLAAWSKVGLKIIESPVPIGATPEYLSGMYMLQSAASMCPVLALSPEPKEKVLDMAAAPGGKTSYMAQLMRNTGVILANDLKAERQKATVANMHRLGVKNVIACVHDGRKIGSLFKNRFDRILLDAPCSGLGVISRDPSVKVQRTIADINQCAHLQKELLLSAIDALKFKGTTGGVMVYSTCSISVAENEEVVNYALSKRDIKIVDTGLDFGKPGFVRYQQKRFHPSVALTRRFYPHVHNMDGFFVCKIQKLSDGRLGEKTGKDGESINEPASIEEQDDDLEHKDEEKAKVSDSGKKEDTKGGKRSTELPDSLKGVKSSPKKRKRKDNADKTKPQKNAKVSVPPQKPKQKKQVKQSAKVTKPRRKRAAMDA